MKVVFNNEYYSVYTSDPAAEAGRIEAIVEVIEPHVEFVESEPATEAEILAAHTPEHVDDVRSEGLYDIAAWAAGGALKAAEIGLTEPCFALIRPPGHHASAASAWGFCYFNNMAVSLLQLKKSGRIETAYVLDIDLHYGDGTENILGGREWVTVFNVSVNDRKRFVDTVDRGMDRCQADVIGISAGFDAHRQDWGGVLNTDDYSRIGNAAKAAALRNGGGFFAILEGGYNHQVLGENVLSLLKGMEGE